MQTERRITRIITTTVNTPHKYDNGITKGWAVATHFITEDGTGPYVVSMKFRLKRDAVAYQQKHINGSNPQNEMTVTTDENGKAVYWTECWGIPYKGNPVSV